MNFTVDAARFADRDFTFGIDLAFNLTIDMQTVA